MYESPINIIQAQFEVELKDEIMKAVHKVYVDINEEELLKALQYDRDQYQKGYNDGQHDSVVHGRWVEDHKYYDAYGDLVQVVQCSECSMLDDEASNFCPNCGAKMDGKDSAVCVATGCKCIRCNLGVCDHRREK